MSIDEIKIVAANVPQKIRPATDLVNPRKKLLIQNLDYGAIIKMKQSATGAGVCLNPLQSRTQTHDMCWQTEVWITSTVAGSFITIEEDF